MPLRHISDTARWIAVLRAKETARPDALFKDPLASKVAGLQGEAIAEMMRIRGGMPEWPIVMRTLVLDEHILRGVRDGVDMVIDLAAGLDTRPYRLDLPASVTWIDVDLPGINAYKDQVLAGETPRCRVERISADLSDATIRRTLFAQLGARCTKALIIAEGLLVYLTEEQVAGLAEDLAAVPTFKYWTLELVSAALLKRLQLSVGKRLAEAGMPMQFGTAEGPAFFERRGWRLIEARSMFHEAGEYRRLPWYQHPFTWLPEPKPPWKAVWAGVCLFERVA